MIEFIAQINKYLFVHLSKGAEADGMYGEVESFLLEEGFVKVNDIKFRKKEGNLKVDQVLITERLKGMGLIEETSLSTPLKNHNFSRNRTKEILGDKPEIKVDINNGKEYSGSTAIVQLKEESKDLSKGKLIEGIPMVGEFIDLNVYLILYFELKRDGTYNSEFKLGFDPSMPEGENKFHGLVKITRERFMRSPNVEMPDGTWRMKFVTVNPVGSIVGDISFLYSIVVTPKRKDGKKDRKTYHLKDILNNMDLDSHLTFEIFGSSEEFKSLNKLDDFIKNQRIVKQNKPVIKVKEVYRDIKVLMEDFDDHIDACVYEEDFLKAAEVKKAKDKANIQCMFAKSVIGDRKNISLEEYHSLFAFRSLL